MERKGSAKWMTHYLKKNAIVKNDRLFSLLNCQNIEPHPSNKEYAPIPLEERGKNEERWLETFMKDILTLDSRTYGLTLEEFIAKSNKWLHTGVGKRATWDMLCEAKIDNHSGLVLVEAKANKSELYSYRELKETASEASVINHGKIIGDISKAFEEMQIDINGYLSVDKRGNNKLSYYQITNRLAYTYWVNNKLNINTVLVFLGFINDSDFDNRFIDSSSWETFIESKLRISGADRFIIRKGEPWSREKFILIRSVDTSKLK